MLHAEARPRTPVVLRDPLAKTFDVCLTVSAPAAAAGNVRRVNLGLVIDRSGSMHTDDKLEAAKAAARAVVDQLADTDTFTVVAFHDGADVIVAAAAVGPNRTGIRQKIDAIQPNGSTMLGQGLRATVAQMAAHIRPGVNSIVYVLTDGKTHDEADSLAFAPEIHTRGIAVYAGGVYSPTDPYNHTFLDAICKDPTTPNALLVDNLNATVKGQIGQAFLDTLNRRGKVLTENCQLQIECLAQGLEVVDGAAEEGGRPLPIDPRNPRARIPLPNLPPGGEAAYQIRFRKAFPDVTTRPVPLVRFRIFHDLPTQNIVGAEATALAEIEVTADGTHGRLNQPDPRADRLNKTLLALKQQASAQDDIARGKFATAGSKLRGSTQIWKDLKRPDLAAQTEQLAEEVAKATPADTDRLVKKGRETNMHQIKNPTQPRGGTNIYDPGNTPPGPPT